jgi:ATP-dependent RNA helicase RhlE
MDRGRGGERPERPVRDATFEHPRREPVKPVTPVEIPPMDTAFTQLGLNAAIAFSVQEKGYSDADPDSGAGHPAGAHGPRCDRLRPDRVRARRRPSRCRSCTGSAPTGRCAASCSSPPGNWPCRWRRRFRQYSKYTDLTTTIVYGGVGYGKQREDLKRGVDVLAATPGRLLDLMEDGTTNLNDIEILVLDEVDRMLDMGFLPDVKRIVQRCPAARQTLFFTATLPPEIASLAAWTLRDPVEVKIGQRRSPAETIAHAFYPVVASQKFDLLIELLKRTDFKSVLIFTRTRMGADRIARRLQEEQHTVGVLHSDRNQRERVEALDGFKSGKFEVLVATDIAARGLDIAGRVTRDQLRRAGESRGLRAPHRPHRPRSATRGMPSRWSRRMTCATRARSSVSSARTIERKKIDDFPYIYSALFDETALADLAPKKTASRLMRGMRR